MTPIENLLEWFPSCDFAVKDHGFLEHGRDYILVVQTNMGRDPGTYKLQFSHVVEASIVSAVSDKAWKDSWSDEFVDYEQWIKAGEPEGYVWGTNWSLAFPGLSEPESPSKADQWAARLEKDMYCVELETDRFKMSLIYHDIRTAKISDDTELISQCVHLLDSD